MGQTDAGLMQRGAAQATGQKRTLAQGAAKGGFEPNWTCAALCTNVCYRYVSGNASPVM